MGGYGGDGNNDHAYIASVVATYWFVSISMVYLNKVLMSSEGISIPAPLFVTWFQCIVTSFICYGAGLVGEYYKKQEGLAGGITTTTTGNSTTTTTTATTSSTNGSSSSTNDTKTASFFAQFPKAEYKIVTGQKVFPLSIIFVGMITFNNLCLKWVEVSFYNVARSLTIVFNVFFTSILLSQNTSLKTMCCLTIVIIGFFIGSNGEVNFSFKGTIAGIASSLFVSLNSIYTKKVLPAVDNDHWRLTYYNNVNASLMFVPMILIFEHTPVSIALTSGQFFSTIFWCAMIIAGFFGFAIGIVTVLQIKATSPLTHNISGTAKAGVQSILAFYIWGNPPTFMGILGIFTVLGGSLLYTLVKMNESKKSSSMVVVPSSTSTSSSQSSSSLLLEKDVELAKESKTTISTTNDNHHNATKQRRTGV